MARNAKDAQLALLDEFVGALFDQLPESAHVGVSLPVGNKPPGYPSDWQDVRAKLHRMRGERKAYVSTASLYLDSEGQLRNRLDNLAAMHFVILDDIGGKCPVDDLPAGLRKPTYIIESSAGNFQYGYKLAEPIVDVEEARLLIGDLYSVGGWDSGGAVAAKYVRLPYGIHGKTKFPVRLVELYGGEVFEPDELRELAEFDVAAPDAQARRAAMRYARKINAQTVDCEGVVDPLLEILNERGMILNDTGTWVQIECPWVSEHTDGDNSGTAYLPIGRGRDSGFRAFKCHHDSCSGQHTRAFLDRMEKITGKKFAVYDPASLLARDWIHVCSYGYVNLQTGVRIGKPDFDERFAEKVLGAQSLAGSWRQHPMRRSLDGPERRPDRADERILESEGREMLNTYRRPPWMEVPDVDYSLLDTWFGFAEYLFPVEMEREYVLNWMAKKVQDPCFRGAVILCVAQAEGTGRTTFWNLFAEILGLADCTTLSFRDLLGAYDDHLTAGFAVCDEASDESNHLSKFSASDTLKQRCDPTPRHMLLNIKSAPKISHFVTTSLVLCTNHADAMSLSENSRRLFVVSNPDEPRAESYFRRLAAWRDARGWQDHLFTWLLRRDVSGWDGYAPPPLTAAKRTMVGATLGDVGVAVRVVLECWPAQYVAEAQVRYAVEQAYWSRNVHNPLGGKLALAVRKEFRKYALMSSALKGDKRQSGDVGGELRKLTAYTYSLPGMAPIEDDAPIMGRHIDWNWIVQEICDEWE